MTVTLLSRAPDRLRIEMQRKMTNKKTRIGLCMSRPTDLDAYGCLIELVAHARIVVRTTSSTNLIRRTVSSKSTLIVMDEDSFTEIGFSVANEQLDVHNLSALVLANADTRMETIADSHRIEVIKTTHDLVQTLRTGESLPPSIGTAFPESIPPSLTSRERQVWALIAMGQSVSEIAAQLGLAESTIDSHKSKLMKKLNARKAVDLARLAIRLGVVEL